ncbi:MAG: glycerophosphodiester phosphodiesterase [Chloroflexota bacterium]
MTPRRPLLLAHRGDWRRAPENSLAALVAALDVPICDGVEFDVRLAADGVPVVMHDATLRRVHGDERRVDALDPDALAALGIPTLEKALQALPASVVVDLDLKGDEHGATTASVVARHRGPDPATTILSSFSPTTLRQMGDELPRLPRWLNADDLSRSTIDMACAVGAAAISAQWRSIHADTVAAVRGAGLDLAAWTARSARTRDRLAAFGLLAICVEDRALD